jgi:carbonic anhydrase/acetyltransferase-like protein (isoleucine patch superfamily)
MALYRIKGHSPVVPPNAYVAAEASLVGEVVLGERCSVWPGAALRGDNEPIRIGEATNIQEGAVLHADAGFPLTIGRQVSVGHQAMLHGCTVGDGSLIGIQAIVLNGAVIGRDCLVAAGALITERKTFPDRSLIVGTPAKLVRELTDEEVQRLGDNAAGYAQKSQLFLTELERVG